MAKTNRRISFEYALAKDNNDNLEDAKKTIDILAKYGDKAYVIGEITNNAGKVVIHK